MEHKFKLPIDSITHKEEGVAKRDYRIKGTYVDAAFKKDVNIDIIIVKGKTKLSDIPDQFVETLKTEKVF